MPITYITKPLMPDRAEFNKGLDKIYQSGILTNNGENVKRLELELKKYLRLNKDIAVFNNGMSALEAILSLIPRGEIITTPFTFPATIHAIERSGHKAVLADINPVDFTIDPIEVGKLINRYTIAILGVHVYGNICDIANINRLCKEYQLFEIYDAAHCFGINYNGKSILEHGDFSMISFHACKLFNTCEGGAVIANDDRFKLIRNFGIEGDDIKQVGFNGKMSELNALWGRLVLPKINKELERRIYIANIYQTELKDKAVRTGVNFAYFPILFKSQKKRDKAFDLLAKNNINARKYFYPVVQDYSCYNFKEETPIARDIAKRILCLPIYGELDLKIVKLICKLIKKL